jgi:hypothetical protein
MQQFTDGKPHTAYELEAVINEHRAVNNALPLKVLSVNNIFAKLVIEKKLRRVANNVYQLASGGEEV